MLWKMKYFPFSCQNSVTISWPFAIPVAISKDRMNVSFFIMIRILGIIDSAKIVVFSWFAKVWRQIFRRCRAVVPRPVGLSYHGSRLVFAAAATV